MGAPSEKMDAYKALYRYKEPFTAICDAKFLQYVKLFVGQPLVQTLESLLGGKVEIVTTICILNALTQLGVSMDPVRIRPSHCDHLGKITAYYGKPDACMRTFIKRFPGRRMVVCTMNVSEITYYKQDPARIVVTTDGKQGVMIASIADSPAPPEFAMMDDFHRMFRIKPPYVVVCQPGFVGFVQRRLGLNLVDTLQDFLCGKIELACSRCILEEMETLNLDVSSFKEVRPCSHPPHPRLSGANCMRTTFIDKCRVGVVICSIDDDINYYRRLPMTINVKPNDNRDGLMLAASPGEVLNLMQSDPVSLETINHICALADANSGAKRNAEEITEKQVVSSKKQHVIKGAIEKEDENKKDSSSKDSDDTSCEFMQTDVQMVDAPSSKKVPQNPATPQATGTKVVFMGNLSYSIEENDIINFFNVVGEVVDVRFAMRGEDFAGYGHVEFTTVDEARKAVELDGSNLLGRYVKIGLAKERGERGQRRVYVPGGNDRCYQKTEGQGLSVFVRGFEDKDFDSLRDTLERHFSVCGEISRLSIPKDFDTGVPKGFAFIDFADRIGYNKALELTGTVVGGGYINVTEAKPRGGSGGRGRNGRSGGRFSGRDGGRGRGRGGDSGGRGRGRGPSRSFWCGKKTTFVDD